MKFSHKIFHIDGDKDRNNLVSKTNDYLDNYSTELNTPTIKISCKEEYADFVSKNLDFNVDPQGFSLNNEQGWKYGEIGIWASNRTSWKNFLNTDSDYLILMEDDIVISDKFIEVLNKSIEQAPDTFDIIHLFAPEDNYFRYNSFHDFGAEDLCYIYQDWSCLCYIISKRGAHKLLQTSTTINLPLDWHMFRQKPLFEIFTLKPQSSIACSLFPTESTFQNTHKREILL